MHFLYNLKQFPISNLRAEYGRVRPLLERKNSVRTQILFSTQMMKPCSSPKYK